MSRLFKVIDQRDPRVFEIEGVDIDGASIQKFEEMVSNYLENGWKLVSSGIYLIIDKGRFNWAHLEKEL
jgi:hypothetical protein